MKFSPRAVRMLLALSLGLNVFLLALPARANAGSHRYQEIFQNVLFYVRTLFPIEIDDHRLFVGAIRGLLSATGDPHTRFLDADEHKEFNQAEGGQRIGVGVEVTLRAGYPVVVAPVPGSPAEKAGIKTGDIIVAIDQQSMTGLEFGRILDLISGPAGSVVALRIKRGDDLFTVNIERGLFDLEYCTGEKIDDVGYIRLTQFYGEESGAITRFRALLLEYRSLKGLILDLRNNTGGHLSMAATLTAYFLKEGQPIVHAQGREGKRSLLAQGEVDLAGNAPLVVLVNEGSASASEIMAGALQDHRRAVIIGKKTFGKASVQRIIRPLPADSALIITTQHYLTPSMRNLQGQGLMPDIVVPEIAPDEEEVFYLKQIRRKGLIENFRTRGAYNETSVARFQEELKGHGFRIRPQLLTIILKQEYGLMEKVDLETDVQLSRAVQFIQTGK
ncbi:MAG: S41 family peptidase [Spirochaetales bacterium]|nr:S41 family peptidase [Spirochaetales bacterium]